MQSRRFFLRIVVAGIASAFILVWNKLTVRHLDQRSTGNSSFAFNRNETVQFLEEYILINSNNVTRVLSSRCTHLGCRINNLDNGRLICPCHGSEYSLEGKVLKGPAYKKLHQHQFKFSEDNSTITIFS